MLRTAVAALLLALVLTACSDGEAPTATSTPTQSTWPPDSALDVPEPEIPDIAFGPIGERAAEGFIRYVVEMASYVLMTGYSGDLQQHAMGACMICGEVLDEAATMKEERYLREGGVWSLVRVRPHPGRIPLPKKYASHIFRFEVTFRTTPLRRIDEDGEVRGTLPAVTLTTMMEVDRFGPADWWVRNWWVGRAIDDTVPV